MVEAAAEVLLIARAVDAHLLEQASGGAPLLTDEAEEDVLGADVVGLIGRRYVPRALDGVVEMFAEIHIHKTVLPVM